jgi:hypothetical protein
LQLNISNSEIIFYNKFPRPRFAADPELVDGLIWLNAVKMGLTGKKVEREENNLRLVRVRAFGDRDLLH